MKPRKFITQLRRTVQIRSKLDEKIEAIERPPARTEWYETESFIRPGGDEPKDRRFVAPRYTYFFKCPHCNKVRQLIESNNLECGKVLCKCGSTFRVVIDDKNCLPCRHLMVCLSKGIVQIKRKKLYDEWIETS
jgi:hypothetical protein